MPPQKLRHVVEICLFKNTVLYDYQQQSLFMGLLNWIFGSEEKQAAKRYNNALMRIINDNEHDISAMNAAMVNQDYATAEKVCRFWENNLDDRINKVFAADTFHGDDSLKKAIIKGLQAYRRIVTEDYPRLINLRSGKTMFTLGPNMEKVRPEELEARLLSNINLAFETAATLVNNARNEFMEKVKQL